MAPWELKYTYVFKIATTAAKPNPARSSAK